jgi:16S rRNA processing protein RimM
MGVILGAHGVRGQAKVKSFAARSVDIAAYGPLEDASGARKFRLRVIAGKNHHRADGLVLVSIDGIDNREAAEALKGVELYVERAELPAILDADTYYAADLVGLSAFARSGAPLGRIENVADFGAGWVLEISGGHQGEFAVPFSNAFVPSVDLERGQIFIDLPADFFAEPAPSAERAEP